MFLLAVILPWNSQQIGASPYVSAFEAMGIPAAAEIMNGVVLTAVLSCLNSGLYTASRMLFVLAAHREAPQRLIALNRRSVPVWATPGHRLPCVTRPRLLNSSGAIILFVYLIICLSQYVLRRRTPEAELPVKMWGFPVLTLLTIAAMVAVLISMGVAADTRSQLVLSLASLAVVLLVYAAARRRIQGGAEKSELARER